MFLQWRNGRLATLKFLIGYRSISDNVIKTPKTSPKMTISGLHNLLGQVKLNGWKAITLSFKFLIFAMTSSSGGKKLDLKTAQKYQKNQSSFKACHFLKNCLGIFILICVVSVMKMFVWWKLTFFLKDRVWKPLKKY